MNTYTVTVWHRGKRLRTATVRARTPDVALRATARHGGWKPREMGEPTTPRPTAAGQLMTCEMTTTLPDARTTYPADGMTYVAEWEAPTETYVVPARSWEWDGLTGAGAPPDYTSRRPPYVECQSSWRGYECTRTGGHTGRHAAGTGSHIVAVWE